MSELGRSPTLDSPRRERQNGAIPLGIQGEHQGIGHLNCSKRRLHTIIKSTFGPLGVFYTSLLTGKKPSPVTSMSCLLRYPRIATDLLLFYRSTVAPKNVYRN